MINSVNKYSGYGTPLWSEEDMKTLDSSANSKGLTVHTHACDCLQYELALQYGGTGRHICDHHPR